MSRLVALFADYRTAELGLEKLLDKGLRRSQIGVLLARDTLAGYLTRTSAGKASAVSRGAVPGARIGHLTGLLVGHRAMKISAIGETLVGGALNPAGARELLAGRQSRGAIRNWPENVHGSLRAGKILVVVDVNEKLPATQGLLRAAGAIWSTTFNRDSPPR